MHELTTLGRTIGELLKTHRETLAVAESSAGGLIAASLLSVPGASAYFRGGVVTYTRESRRTLLAGGIEQFDGVPPSSEEFALVLARAVRQTLGGTWGVGETGAAGPTGNRYGYDTGHACIAVSGPLELSATIETRSRDRERNMWAFAAAALELLQTAVDKHHVG